MTEDAATLLERAIISLVYREELYANILMLMTREISTRLPTAGVSIRDNSVHLAVNPYFFKSLDEEGRIAVLIHEAAHVLNNHFDRFEENDQQIAEADDDYNEVENHIRKQINQTANNIAADLAINEYIPALPKTFSTFDKDGKLVSSDSTPCTVREYRESKEHADMEHLQCYEYYLEWLKEHGSDDGTCTIDCHSGMVNTAGKTKDQIKEIIRELARKAAEGMMAGNIPAHQRIALDKLLHVPRNWKQDLQRFVAKACETKVVDTRKKRHRRYGILHPGQKIESDLHLAIGWDTSGSMGPEELSQIRAELNKLHAMEVKMTVIECDAEVGACYEYDPKRKAEITGGGGTLCKPVFDHVRTKVGPVDGMIYFTDGGLFDGQDSITEPQFPVLWALTPPYDDRSLPFTKKVHRQTTKVEIKNK